MILPNELNGHCCIFLGTHAKLNKIQPFSLRTKYVERVCNGNILSEVGVLLFQRSNRLQEFIIRSHLFDIRNIILRAVLRGKYLKFYFFRTYVDVKKFLTWNN